MCRSAAQAAGTLSSCGHGDAKTSATWPMCGRSLLACLAPERDLGGKLGAGGNAQLGEHMHQVSLDGPAGDEQPLPDLRIGQPVGDQ